jgi:hypothetical protein
VDAADTDDLLEATGGKNGSGRRGPGKETIAGRGTKQVTPPWLLTEPAHRGNPSPGVMTTWCCRHRHGTEFTDIARMTRDEIRDSEHRAQRFPGTTPT